LDSDDIGEAPLAGVWLGVGCLVKFWPALALPIFAIRGPIRARMLILSFLLTLALGYGAAFPAGWHPWGSVGAFLTHWSFGSPINSAFQALRPPEIARAILPWVFATGGILAVWRFARRFETTDEAVLWALGA